MLHRADLSGRVTLATVLSTGLPAVTPKITDAIVCGWVEPRWCRFRRSCAGGVICTYGRLVDNLEASWVVMRGTLGWAKIVPGGWTNEVAAEKQTQLHSVPACAHETDTC
jgi:hypothetical protein